MEVCHPSTIADARIVFVDEERNPTGETIRFQDLSSFPGCMAYNRPFDGESEYWLYSFTLDNGEQIEPDISTFTNIAHCSITIFFNQVGRACAGMADARCPLYGPLN